MSKLEPVAVIGGTGALGGGVAARLARAGIPVIIGSRTVDRAEAAAKELSAETGFSGIRGMTNLAAAEIGQLVVVAVPFASQETTLREIAPAVRGKIVIDTTVPLVPPKVARVQLPAAGSAAVMAAGYLGTEVALVTAFHNVSAQKLHEPGRLACDVLVFGDDVPARDAVVGLIDRLDMRGLHGGPLANSAAAEAMTSVLISINKRYGVTEGAGLQITGLAAAG